MIAAVRPETIINYHSSSYNGDIMQETASSILRLTTGHAFAMILAQCRIYAVSDPRDRIFGLLGLVLDSHDFTSTLITKRPLHRSIETLRSVL